MGDRVRGSKGSLVIGVYYRPPDQSEPVNDVPLATGSIAIASWRTSTIQTSAEKVAKRAMGNQGGSWNAPRITS